eukprot:5438225-Pyramimonas_sp.AAC.1
MSGMRSLASLKLSQWRGCHTCGGTTLRQASCLSSPDATRWPQPPARASHADHPPARSGEAAKHRHTGSHSRPDRYDWRGTH